MQSRRKNDLHLFRNYPVPIGRTGEIHKIKKSCHAGIYSAAVYKVGDSL